MRTATSSVRLLGRLGRGSGRGPLGSRRRRVGVAAVLVAAGLGAGIPLAFAGGSKPLPPWEQPALQPSGHVVTHLWLLAKQDPQKLRAVSFRIDPPGAIGVQAQLHVGGPWYGCSNDNGSVLCAFDGDDVRLGDVTDLTVRVVR